MKRLIAVLVTMILGAPAIAGDDLAYFGSGKGSFGTLDLATGAFTPIGSGFGFTPAGLGLYNGTLYTASFNATGTLYSINTTTGALTAIGNSGIDYFGGIGSTTSGLYGIGSNGDLYSINPTTGAATAIGPTGAPLGSWRDLSTGGNTLYFGNGPDLYSINTTTGAATLIGAFGGPATIGAMVYENGTMYGGDQGRSLIDTINLGTGAATPLPGVSATNVWGLAPDNPTPVPVPGSLPLLATVLAGAMAWRVRARWSEAR